MIQYYGNQLRYLVDRDLSVRKVDSAIHWINYYLKDSAIGFVILILWIAIYSVDSTIQPPPPRGGLLPYKRLMGMCRWLGSHFHDWIDYHWGSHFQ